MQKRGLGIFLIFLLMASMLAFPVFAQDSVGIDDGVEVGVEDNFPDPTNDEVNDKIDENIDERKDKVGNGKEKELVDAGLTPDSPFYWLDEFFDRFGDDIDNKEEKIAEIKQIIEEGKIEEAKKALHAYKKKAESIQKEINPEDKDRAKESSEAIKEVIEEIKDNIPEEERKEFVDDILEKEDSIVTAAEIASKIKGLCVQLSEIDPAEYYRICKTEDDAPDWQKKLDKDLTKEQIEEAKKFGKIMTQCFKTSGQDCDCEEIPFPEFAETCSMAAPLATACDVKGDKDACEKLDNLDMPDLPSHLQDVMDELEKAGHERYDIHMPRECVEAGETSPKECSKIMIEIGAPEECKQALLDSGCQAERECRKICDEIMFDLHAPMECIDKGITDPEECGRFMDSFRSDDHMGPRGHDCHSIENDMERLACFDNKGKEAFDRGFEHKAKFGGLGGKEEECMMECVGDNVRCSPGPNGEENPKCKACAEKCSKYYEGPCMTDEDWKREKAKCQAKFGENAGDQPIYGDSGQGYDCPIAIECIDFRMPEDDVPQECKEVGALSWEACKKHQSDVENVPKPCDDCESQCESRSGQRLRGTGCGLNGCECYYEDDDYQDDYSNDYYQEPVDDVSTQTDDSAPVETVDDSSSDSGSDSNVDDSSSDSENDDSSDDSSSDSGSDDSNSGDSTVTGNAFLDYYYN